LNKFKNLTYFSVRLLILLLFLPGSEEPDRPPPHQAPTLIGCKFLKIVREVAVKTAQLPASFCVAASAAEKRDYEDCRAICQQVFLLRLTCRSTSNHPQTQTPQGFRPGFPSPRAFIESAKDRNSSHARDILQVVF
jgi:hypothetical protein